MTVAELCALARSMPEYEDLGRGATDAEIEAMEKKLGVRLPDAYRRYLGICGYAAWDGGSVSGIGNVINDCQTATLSARASSIELRALGVKPVPANTIFVGQAGNGRCLLYCEGSPRAGEVACHEDDYEMGAEVEYWKTFEDFFEWKLKGTKNSIVVADWSKYSG